MSPSFSKTLSGVSLFLWSLLTIILSFYSDLSAGVDVYADWIDACDAVAKDSSGEAGRNDAGGNRTIGSAGPSGRAAVTSADAEEEVAYGDE